MNFKQILIGVFITLLFVNNITSQDRTAEFKIDQTARFKKCIDLKDDGFLVVYNQFIGKINKAYIYYYTNDLKFKWSKDFTYNADFYATKNGFPIYREYRKINGSFYSKYITLERIEKDGTITSKEILSKINDNSIYSIHPKKNGVDILFKSYKTKKKKSHFTLKSFDDEFNFISEKQFDVLDEFLYYKKDVLDDKILLYELEIFERDKKNPNKKLRADIATISLDGKTDTLSIESAKRPITRIKTRASNGLVLDTRLNRLYFTYINDDGNYFYIDCFDLKGELIWSKKHKFMKEKSLDNSHKYNRFTLQSMDDKLLGYQIMLKDQAHIYNHYISKETGEIVSKNDYKFTGYIIHQMTLSDNYIMTQNNGIIGEVLVKRAKKIEDKKLLKQTRYIYLDKGNYFLLVIYAVTEMNLYKFNK